MGFVLDVNHSSCRDLTLWNWMIPVWMVLNIGCGERALFCWTPRFSRQILWTMRPKWLTWSVCGSHSSCPLGCFQWYPLAVLDRCNWQLGRPSVPLRPSTGNSMRWEKDLTTIGSVLPLLQSPGCRILSRFFHSVLWRWEWIRMDYIMENNSDLVNF